MPYVKKLQGKGNKNISNFVKNGGSYLGICAGGYYGCSSVQFAQGDPLLEVVGPRELALFPGISQGPVFPGFDYANNEGAMAADVRLTQAGQEMLDLYDTTKKSTFNRDDVTITSSLVGEVPEGNHITSLKIYYNGGCHFIDNSQDDTAFKDFSLTTTSPSLITSKLPSPSFKVLATYSAPNEHLSKFVSVGGATKRGPLCAIVAGRYGRGRVALSGVHFEASSELLKQHYKGDPYIESLLPHIAGGDAAREKLLTTCVKYLLNHNEKSVGN